MQAIDYSGIRREIKRYNEKEMKELLDDPQIKEVRVFNMVRGDEVEVLGKKYIVQSISKSGDIHLKALTSVHFQE